MKDELFAELVASVREGGAILRARSIAFKGVFHPASGNQSNSG